MRWITRHRGFTLIELMMALAIIAILVTTAYGGYSRQITESRRAEGRRALLEVAAKQEQFYLDYGFYTSDLTRLGYDADPLVTEHGYYRITATVQNQNQTFLLTATRQNAQADDDQCGNLTVNNFGVRSATDADDPKPHINCW